MTPETFIVHLVILLLSGAMFAIVTARAVQSGRRSRARRREDILRRIAGAGFHVEGDPFRPGFRMTRVVDGLPVTVSAIEEPVMSRHGWRTEYRGTFEANVPSRWSDAAILRYAPQHFGVGHMHEVALDRMFPYRVFAVDPAHPPQWLGPSIRAALIQLGVVQSIVIRSGRVRLTTSWPIVSPEYAGPLTSIVADIHNGRAPIHLPARVPAPPAMIAAETVALIVSISVAVVAGIGGVLGSTWILDVTCGWAMPCSDGPLAAFSAFALVAAVAHLVSYVAALAVIRASRNEW